MKVIKKLCTLLFVGLFALILFACKEDLNKVINKLSIPKTNIEVVKDISLPTSIEKYTISWKTNSETYKVENNTLKVPKLPEETTTLKLIATITSGKAEASKEFSITINKAKTLLKEYSVTKLNEEIELVAPSGIDLTKVKENTELTFKVNIPSGKIVDELKVNNEIKAIDSNNQFKVVITKDTSISVTFKNIETTTKYTDIKDALSLADDTEFNLNDVVIVEVLTNNKALVASRDYKHIMAIYKKEAFKELAVNDVIKVKNLTKTTSEKYGIEFRTNENTEIEKIDNITSNEPELTLTKENYVNDNLNKLFNAVKLEITKIKKIGVMITYLIVKDESGNTYKINVDKTLQNEEVIKKLKEGTLFDLKKIRLEFYQELQLRLNKLTQLQVYASDDEIVNNVVNNIELPQVVKNTDTINLKTTDNGVNITWQSSNDEIINPTTGLVKAQLVENNITLTATFTYKEIIKTKKYVIKVNPRPRTAQELVELIPEPTYSLGDSADSITKAVEGQKTIMNLETEVNIKWMVEDPNVGAFIDNIFTPSNNVTADIATKFIAEVEVSGIKATKEFSVTIKKNSLNDTEKVDNALASLNLPSEINSDQALDLMASSGDVNITWEETSSPKLLDLTTHKLLDQDITSDKTITLVATLSLNSVSKTKEFSVKFKAIPKTAAELAQLISEPTYADGDSATSITKPVVAQKTIMNLETVVSISWSVEDYNAGSFTNNIFTPDSNITADITTKFIAQVEVNGEIATKEFNVTIKKNALTDEEKVDNALSTLNLLTELDEDEKLNLITTSDEVNITWEETSSPQLLDITSGGLNQSITENKTITLTATLTLNGVSKTKEFSVLFKFCSKVTIAFDLNGGSATPNIESQEIIPNKGKKVLKPETIPTFANELNFRFWSLTNTEDASEYNFDTEVTSGFTLYAIYEKLSTIKEVFEKTSGDYTIEGVVVGVTKKIDSFLFLEKVSYIINDGTALIGASINNPNNSQVAKLNQKVRFRGTRSNTLNGDTLTPELNLDATKGHYITKKDENQAIPSVLDSNIINMPNGFDFNNNHYRVVKFSFTYKNIMSEANEYEITDENGNTFNLALNLPNDGELLNQLDIQEIQTLLKDNTKFGKYEVIGLVSESKNQKKVYLFDKSKFNKIGELSDQDKVDMFSEDLDIDPKIYKNDATITLPTTSNGISIAWSEEGTNLLTISGGSINLTDNNITSDTEIVIKATITLNGASTTKTFTIKFLKKVENATSSIYNFEGRNDYTGSPLDNDGLKALLEKYERQANASILSITQTSNVFDGHTGYGGHSDELQKQALKIGSNSGPSKTVIKFSKKIKQVKIKARSYSSYNNANLSINNKQAEIHTDEFQEYTIKLRTATDTITFETLKKQIISIMSIEFVYE